MYLHLFHFLEKALNFIKSLFELGFRFPFRGAECSSVVLQLKSSVPRKDCFVSVDPSDIICAEKMDECVVVGLPHAVGLSIRFFRSALIVGYNASRPGAMAG